MALILNIETATEVCSVCLSDDGNILSVKETGESNRHSSVLTSLIQSVFSDVSKSLDEIDAVAMSTGPGSYTGLRIGASVAKGLCYSLDIPLVPVSTLRAMVNGIISQINNDHAYFCPLIDARRMEVYTAVYDSNLKEIVAPVPRIIDSDFLASFGRQGNIYLFGSGSEKCKSVLTNPNFKFIGSFKNSAIHLVELAERNLSNGQVANITYYEPFYLKNFTPFKN